MSEVSSGRKRTIKRSLTKSRVHASEGVEKAKIAVKGTKNKPHHPLLYIVGVKTAPGTREVGFNQFKIAKG
jgi:hypothetical protein